MTGLRDQFGRTIEYLRISVTDRCNFRCSYCMPVEGLPWLPKSDILSYEEIAEVVRQLAPLGLRRVRITGGEPTIRPQLPTLVRMIPGSGAELNQTLEHAGRVADFLELGELMCRDALHREESCGGHFRTEHQTPDGEALRDDEHFAYVAAWEYAGEGKAPVLNKEPLVYENIKLSQRSYK